MEGDMKLLKFLCIFNTVATVLLWVFVLVTSDLKGIAMDRTEELARKQKQLEEKVEFIQESAKVDTLVVRMTIDEIKQVKNNIKKTK